MNRQDRSYFKNLLLSRQDSLCRSDEKSENSTKAVALDQSSVGRLSRMDAMQSQAMAKELKRRREIELTRIEAALERLDEEEYGYCASCAEEINRKRLEIDPANPFCVACAEKL